MPRSQKPSQLNSVISYIQATGYTYSKDLKYLDKLYPKIAAQIMGLSISSARAMFPHKIWEDLLKYTMDEWLIEREEDSNFDTKQYFAELFRIIKKVKYAEDLMFIRLNMLLRTSVPDVISINGKRIQKTLVQNYNHTPEYLSALKKQLIQWGEYITSNDKVYVEPVSYTHLTLPTTERV